MLWETRNPAGRLELEVQQVSGASAVVQGSATSPLKLLTPRPRGRSVWAYVSSYGGGMVSGDEHHLDVTIGAGATAFFGTQSSTKVYRSPSGLPCVQRTRATVGEDSFLAWVPDPVQAFAGARYRQEQEVRISASSGLVWVDGFTAGRSERGEHWQFGEYRTRTELWVEGTRRWLDSVVLQDGPEVPVGVRMGYCQAMTLILLWGPPLATVVRELLERIQNLPAGRGASTRLSASPLAGGLLIRVVGTTVEAVRRLTAECLEFLPAHLGDDPLARKW